MTAHVVFPAFDPVPYRPATISPAILRDLMRHELGFSGLVVTDCMEMDAIKNNVGTAQGTFLAIDAGADQVLISHTAQLQEASYDRLSRGAINGELSATRLKEALRSVSETKSQIRTTPFMVDRAEAQQLAQTLWEGAVAGVGALDRLPLMGELTLVTFSGTRQTPAMEQSAGGVPPLVQLLHPQVQHHFSLDQDPNEEAILKVHRAARGMPLVVALDQAIRHPRQLRLLNRPWTDGLIVALALSSPYDLRRIPVGSLGLTAFDPSGEAQAALVKALQGKISPSAQWPITLEVRNR